jgi:hypothetical protein
MRVAIEDISRGGTPACTAWWAAVRSENGQLALSFRQDEAVLRRIDRALARLGAGTPAAAA